MENNQQNSPKSFEKGQSKGTKKEYANRLFNEFYKEPLSRRMGATRIGFTDQTYMVTQFVSDWIKQGKAQVIGIIKCSRSGRKVQKITTNPELFISNSTNQLNLFE
jgi:hypothetical protein